ncbi:MAG: DHA2 family efflux MFS transporter permease subunit [Acidimicrobiales bacterium]
MSDRRRSLWALVITSTALFMTSLDNLVVTMALPVIRTHLHTGLAGLEWTVNAYTLTFAVLLLTGAALGDRFGRRRLFVAGLSLFTLSSAGAALAPSIGWLVAARAVQGVGSAVVTPLTLTLLSVAVSPQRRNFALGIWGAVGGLAVAVGPLVGGAVVQGISWQWIFWLNVPIGVVLVPLAWRRLEESKGRALPFDLSGVALASLGLLGVVLGLVRANAHGWKSGLVLAAFAVGGLALGAFVVNEHRSRAPTLPLRLFRSRGFSAVNGVTILMGIGMFGSIFLLAQFLQTVQHYSPLGAGLRTLPWTAMPMLVAPLAGALLDRVGGRRMLTAGMALMAAGLAWLALVLSPTVPYADLVPAFVMAGVGMALFFVPVASVVLGSVGRADEGVASGVNNATRELGGVLGIAVLSSIFAAAGGYTSGSAFVAGLAPAVLAGAALAGVAALVALAIPGPLTRSVAASRAAEGGDGYVPEAPLAALSADHTDAAA